jgi:hypothetical protein
MRRTVTAGGLFALLGLLAWSWAAAPAPQPAAPAPQPPGASDPWQAKLCRRVKFGGFDDPKITLMEALKQLAKRYDLTFDLNEKAFAEAPDDLPDVLKTPIADKTPIPEGNVSLGTVLKRVLARVPAQSTATFLIRRDCVEITTGKALRREVWGEDYRGPRLPLVHVTLDRRPLEEALKELAEQSDFNIVLDAGVGEKARTPVTARLRNTPLDRAVCLLADMAELRPVHLHNVLSVTTAAKADALEARLKKQAPEKKPQKKKEKALEKGESVAWPLALLGQGPPSETEGGIGPRPRHRRAAGGGTAAADLPAAALPRAGCQNEPVVDP